MKIIDDNMACQVEVEKTTLEDAFIKILMKDRNMIFDELQFKKYADQRLEPSFRLQLKALLKRRLISFTNDKSQILNLLIPFVLVICAVLSYEDYIRLLDVNVNVKTDI